MKITERISEDILRDIRKNVGADNGDDDSFDDDINTMSRNDLFESFMQWNGIIGYESMIKKAIHEIYRVNLEEKEYSEEEE